ncbi:dbc402df-af12-49a9-a52a-f963f9be615c [Sclerotinia trifoliorum]|uniref:Dbc402df-af12-49a9-a52a-f963f9be615c n=1 Tax=Sclerotinia trifoliorum TaxID=28548 RepID=A0A8H2ZK97_9HELO|nr:dbc402df-af12-49a9-a52a-f963f9be615c [Sclerotinia trifoliorum]
MSEGVGLLSTSAEFQLDDAECLQEKEFELRGVKSSKPRISFALWLLYLIILLLSLTTNLVQFRLWSQAHRAASVCKLPLAGLEPNIEVDFGEKTAYGDLSDLAALDKLWLSIDTNPGVVALPFDYHLGSTDAFPWDNTKGLYVMNSFHSMHCLQALYGYVRNCDSGANQTQTLEHAVHCLDVLRSEVMCTADDTPLSFRFQEVVQAERAPKRKCRDWNKLVEYTTAHSACFRRYSPNDPRYSTLDEYLFCPPDSPYKALVEDFLAQDFD